MEIGEKPPLMGYLVEFRKRLIACAIAVLIGFVICYGFSEELFRVLVSPLKANMPEGDKLIYTGLPDMFFTYMKTGFVAGFLLASPFVFYQLWMFVAPGLHQRQKKSLVPFVIFSTVLFVGGALFGYFIVFPLGFRFFLGYANEHLHALPSVKHYFSFSVKLLFAFGIVFELPVVIYFFTRIGLISAGLLREKRKYAIVINFIVAALLTPADVVSQFMMVVPLIVIYEIGIIVAMIAGRRRIETDADGPTVQ
jgi:sec-independent protein translocase protein TatC